MVEKFYLQSIEKIAACSLMTFRISKSALSTVMIHSSGTCCCVLLLTVKAACTGDIVEALIGTENCKDNCEYDSVICCQVAAGK